MTHWSRMLRGLSAIALPDFMKSADKWYRGLAIKLGPDGSVFVSDWYDARACHQQKPHDRTNGRIYKIVYQDVKQAPVDIAKLGDAELVKLQLHKNEWQVRQARRVLQERGPKPEVHQQLLALLNDAKLETPQRLRALWALHATAGLDEKSALTLLRDQDEYVRAWTIHSLCEDGNPPAATLERFPWLAKDDPSAVVRLYLATALQRLPIEQRWKTLERLVGHPEDMNDPNLPMMIWYAAEPAIAADPGRGTTLVGTCKIAKLQEFIARRITSLSK